LAQDGIKRALETPQVLRSFFEVSPVPFAISSRDGGLLYANAPYLALIGIEKEDLPGIRTSDFYADPQDRESLVRKLLEDEGLQDEVVRARRRDGTLFWCNVSARAVRFDGQEVFFSILSDVTEQIRADNSLRLREHQLTAHNRALIELTSNDVLWTGDLAASITEVAARTLEVERTSIWLFEPELGRLVCSDLFVRSKNSHESGAILEAARYPRYFEALRTSRIINADQASTDARTSEFTRGCPERQGIIAMLDAPVRVEGEIVAVICHEHIGPPRLWTSEEQNFAASMTDMVALAMQARDRHRAERALAAERDLLDGIMQTSVAAIVLVDRMGRIEFANPQAELMLELPISSLEPRRYGRPEWHLSSPEGEKISPEDLPFRRIFSQGERIRGDRYRATWPNGRTLYLSVNGAPLQDGFPEVSSAVFLIQDITAEVEAERERQELTERLRRAQKLEAVGQLAGGIAHDYNNLLMVILGHAELASESNDPKIHEHLRAVRKAAERAAILTRRLLAFSGQQVMVPSRLDLNRHLEDRIARIQDTVGEGVEVHLHSDPSLPFILADPAQVDQIILNLCANASEAMSGRGRLAIETRMVEAPPAAATPAPWIRVRIQDDGCGMSSEEVEKCFDPFFSSRSHGQKRSKGMGLSIVHGAVTQHGGTIEVESTLGEGTTFTVQLPAQVNSESPVFHGTTVNSSRRSILLAEDEEPVHRLTAMALESAGYRVLSARDGEEAIAMFDAHHDEIALLVLDVVMPKVGGFKVWEHVRRGHDARILFISGYTENALRENALADPGVCFLRKPFTTAELLREVEQAFPRSGISHN